MFAAQCHSEMCAPPFFQYLGDTLSEKVKTRVVALLYGWTVSLPDEAKISEAYQMLKSQGESDASKAV